MKRNILAFFLMLTGILIFPDSFSFVVMGDTRPPLGTNDYGNFNKLLGRIDDYHPDFIINVGDLIIGYGSRDKANIWDKYKQIISGIKYKYYQLPGNHDIFSKKGEALYDNIFK